MSFDQLRDILYPLGWIASILFFLRFYIQWLKSEKQKKSHVTPLFWHLSFSANCVMAIHSFIQLQYPILLIQICNSVISWRNLELMREKKRGMNQVLIFMATLVMSVSIPFLFLGNFTWMHAPKLNLGFNWHLFGFLGMVLFASRFWIQWMQAEKKQTSHLSRSFWWISLIGATLSFIYFVRLQDFVQITSYGLGMLPYARNLMLLRKKVPLQKDHLFFVAGEKSGDLLGSKLISALKQQSPYLMKGVGGNLMRDAGMEPFLPMEKLNVMGFTDVIKALPRILFSLQKIKQKILADQPEKVILIDYPDFNMLLAKRLRKSGYKGKIIHYVSPSVWAWRKKRTNELAKTCDALLSIFPFEKKHYAHTKLPVSYVGHPLVSSLKNISIANSKKYLSLFPGSRLHAVKKNLPIQLQVAKKWLAKNKDFVLAVSSATPEIGSYIENELKIRSMSAEIIPFENRYSQMEKSVLALATSGTVTLELALHQVPTLVTYLLSPLNYYLGRYIFKIHMPHYCIVNIIAEKEIYPEFVGKKLSVDALTIYLDKLFIEKETCKTSLKEVKEKMGHCDASLEAATIINSI